MVQLVTAIIKPHRLDEVKDALRTAGVVGMTATEVRGFGRQGGKTESYRGTEYNIELLPKIKVEVLIDGADADRVIDAIATAARTDKIGDGKIWSVAVDQVLRIRTGEAGTDAL
jgi:nitrogen regulatory protein P-II 1